MAWVGPPRDIRWNLTPSVFWPKVHLPAGGSSPLVLALLFSSPFPHAARHRPAVPTRRVSMPLPRHLRPLRGTCLDWERSNASTRCSRRPISFAVPRPRLGLPVSGAWRQLNLHGPGFSSARGARFPGRARQQRSFPASNGPTGRLRTAPSIHPFERLAGVPIHAGPIETASVAKGNRHQRLISAKSPTVLCWSSFSYHRRGMETQPGRSHTTQPPAQHVGA